MQDAVQALGIPYLVHFTRLCNLNRILSEGLKSRKNLEQEGREYLFSDNMRFDRHSDAICLSISFPNYKMFYSLREANSQDRWAVILIQPKLLWEKDCAFFKTNAASNDCRFLDISSRKSRQAFLELFDEQSKVFQDENRMVKSVEVRSYFNLPANYTTDPQAEVLCFESIETDYIMEICFQSEDDRKSVCIPNGFNCVVNQWPFYGRKDFLAWK